mgnify:CR=1 FL=1
MTTNTREIILELLLEILEQKKLKYTPHYYDPVKLDACYVAEVLNQNPNQVFKTLVTRGKSGSNYVFVIPCDKELDLKKAASAANEKSIEMIKSKELLPLTGYIHGGCSPIGMKKQYVTVVDTSALECETIIFSAGKIGAQVELKPSDLEKIVPLTFQEITQD